MMIDDVVFALWADHARKTMDGERLCPASLSHLTPLISLLLYFATADGHLRWSKRASIAANQVRTSLRLRKIHFDP